ncbi:MAG: DUF4241 domain-containing protein [Clostridia bacterium]|nr:DUF4241 domain-containing protein [Clostridia bacterium]
MKITVKIPKDRLTAPIDFGEVLTSRCVCGVKLSYAELPFIQLAGQRIVVFDAYSSAHGYEPFDIECGVIGFPFYCGCMTDDGERVAYCGVRFGEGRATVWKPLFKKEVLGLLAVNADAGAIAIGSGVCCISGEDGYVQYRAHIKDDVHPLDGHIVLNGQTHTEVELYGNKYAVFSTGWGDGMYRCYVGYDENGVAVAVIADFGMIEYPPRDGSLVDVEIEGDEQTYYYDPAKSERENNIAQWTHALAHAVTAEDRLNAYTRRGYAYHLDGNTDAALSDYMSAVECCGAVTDGTALHRAWFVYDNAAEILCSLGEYERAIELMNAALAVGDSFYSGAYVRLIDLYRLLKREDSALAAAQAMCAARPDDPVAHIKYAECCVAVTDYERAAEAFGKLATEFRLYENYFDAASCLIALGDYERADGMLEKHPAKDQYEQYWYYKAYIDFKQHKYRSALDNAEISHSIDPEYMPALYLLIDVESVLQEHHAVARYAEEYKKLRPNSEYGYSVCAEAQLILGNFSECARNYLYLYRNIKQDDRYAALAVMIGYETSEKKHCSGLLRILRKKRSPYYIGAIYSVYLTKYSSQADELDKLVKQLRGDAEFLMQLSLYLIGRNYIVPATRILGLIGADKSNAADLVPLQIRLADKIGDKKQFMTFLDYYIEHILKTKFDEADRVELGKRFMSAPQSRTAWF